MSQTSVSVWHFITITQHCSCVKHNFKFLKKLKNLKQNGSKEARTPDLSRVRRTLIPAELCFHASYYSTCKKKCKSFLGYHANCSVLRTSIILPDICIAWSWRSTFMSMLRFVPTEAAPKVVKPLLCKYIVALGFCPWHREHCIHCTLLRAWGKSVDRRIEISIN